MRMSMGILRVSVSDFGLSMLALMSNWGCGGAAEPDVSNSTGGTSLTSNVDAGGTGLTGSATPTGGAVTRGIGGNGFGVGGSGVGGAAAGGVFSVTCTPSATASDFVHCSEGYTHRTDISDCTSELPRPTTCGASVSPGGCQSDAECKDRANGYCTPALPSSSCYCNYGCVRDSDCAAGQICECGDPVGHCVESKCSSDADCNGGLCASYDVNPGCGGVAFACTSALDACTGGAQCAGGYCAMGASGFRVCANVSCAIGRPFLVAGEDRRAVIIERSDWSESSGAMLRAGLSSEQAARLGQHYSMIAQMEHAAVAAFARLLLELIGQGAPADLIERVILAQADEARHAKLAFGLASELLGKNIGPGSLPLTDAKLGASLEELAYNTVLEGCVGETIAALEAAECRA
ncbi:MAG TPA: ferritin-like domain-containing protein, partial [Polyangiaceae bacterium]